MKNENEIMVVPTMRDEIIGDATWCATFQLAWNNMCEFLKGRPIFNP